MTELDEKTERLARLAKQSDFAGILLTTQTNFAWLTGGRSSRIDGSREPGETFNPPGHWSSFPPHKHDGRDGEPALEEVYYYRVDPPQGFRQQMLYTNDGESAVHAVRDGDVVLLLYGYHPVSTPPGYRLYYLWGMADEQRRLALFEDPAHTWIHDAP